MSAAARTGMAMRVRSQWFKPGAPKSAQEQAGALGFIVWRAARQMLQRMRQAGFDIDAGPAYFAFLREVCVFLITVLDRNAHARLGADERAAFTSALVRHCAATYDDSARDLLGASAAGTSHADALIELFNACARHYAEFGADPEADAANAGYVPDFAGLRYFASRLAATVPPKDEHWVADQVMAIEAPEAVKIVNAAMANLYSTEPRRRRREGAHGD
ncbi:MAG: hypothetical protein U1E89_08075 [Burkholderiaceae bacterium]